MELNFCSHNDWLVGNFMLFYSYCTLISKGCNSFSCVFGCVWLAQLQWKCNPLKTTCMLGLDAYCFCHIFEGSWLFMEERCNVEIPYGILCSKYLESGIKNTVLQVRILTVRFCNLEPWGWINIFMALVHLCGVPFSWMEVIFIKVLEKSEMVCAPHIWWVGRGEIADLKLMNAPHPFSMFVDWEVNLCR